MSANPGLGFVLLSNPDRPQPSTRIAALNLFPDLRAAGYRPEVCFAPSVATEQPDFELDIEALKRQGIVCMVFQKVRGPSAERQLARLRESGIATIFMCCDAVESSMAAAADITVVVTEHLRSLYPSALQPRIRVVHDGIERPDICQREASARTGSRDDPLRAVIVTSATLGRVPGLVRTPPWLSVRVVGRYDREMPAPRWRQLARAIKDRTRKGALERAAFALDTRITCVPWHPDGVYSEMLRADIGLIPRGDDDTVAPPRFPEPIWQVKSENRLTMMMSAGLPVVAAPVPAYLSVVEQGRTAFLAATRQDWLRALVELRDPARRDAMGRAARAAVVDRFSVARQAGLFLHAVSEALHDMRLRQRDELH